MADTLRHRGPDSEGYYVDPFIALGIRRLSIIDLETGDQPIPNEDGTVWGALNGEIYNFQTLRAHLQSLGHCFRTRSDTEVLVHAYEEYGAECVHHFDGMFALVIWDVRQRTLLLARDRMGEKPLYYHAGPAAFVFGSELRALLAHPAVPRELSFESLSRYLAFEYIPAPHSILTGIEKLPPGHLLTASPESKPQVISYWDLSFAPDGSVGADEWARALRQQLERSVRQQLVSDVPLGLFLSGGVDSSAVTAIATQVCRSRSIKTFCLGFGEASYDERPFARAVAQHCGTDHAEVEFSPTDAAVLLENVGDLLDEPLGDSSFLPLYRLSQAARRSVTVVLSGDGGDELFCGYPTFLADRGARWLQRLPRWVRSGAACAVSRLAPSTRYGSVEFLLKQFFRGLPFSPEVRTQLLLGGLTSQEQSTLFSTGMRATTREFEPYMELVMPELASRLAPIDRLIYQHCKFYLAGQNLVTVDRASMACGLEVRAPFVDRALVDLAGRIPSQLKLAGWRTKYILKRALRDLLPKAILARRKQGFGVPIGQWLRGPLRWALEERLAPERVARLGLFDPEATARLMNEHFEGVRDHRKVLWSLLMFDAWRDRYLPSARWS
jgi:asparagine synthase (glutamine-hydrolysing)